MTRWLVSGAVFFLAFGVLAGENRVDNARAVAEQYLREHAAAYGIRTDTDLREYLAYDEPAYDVTHFKYSQWHQGVPVLYGQLFLHVKGGRVLREQNMLKERVEVATIEPWLCAEDAVNLAIRNEQVIGAYEVRDSLLAILPRGSLDGSPARDRLVWQVTIHVENELEQLKSFETVVDATDGTIWTSYSLLREVAGPLTSPALPPDPAPAISPGTRPRPPRRRAPAE